MAKKNVAVGNDYFGMGGLISLILAIIPVTSWILGAITSLKEKRYVAFIVRLVGGFTVVWILDLIFMITMKRITRLILI